MLQSNLWAAGAMSQRVLTIPVSPYTYAIAEPNVGHLSKVTTTASLLAKESFDSEQEMYEFQDRSDTPYLGDSMGLAYLPFRRSICLLQFFHSIGDRYP